jgi:SEL1 protein
MARLNLSRKSLVSPTPIYHILQRKHTPNIQPAKKKPQSLTDWLAAFLAGWDDYEGDEHFEGDDYYDATDDIDSDILESLIILALSGALAFLLYYRTQRQRRQEEERRRQEEQQRQLGVQVPQQPEQDRGVFPNPGDPEFLNWVAGGGGH